MKYIFDKKQIELLLSDFYISTGIAVTLYDASMSVVAKSPVFSEFCSCIRKFPACIKSCSCSDLAHMKTARETGNTVFYLCHAGLSETVTPIYYDDTLIAFVQTGQFREEGDAGFTDGVIAEVASSYGISFDMLTALYQKTTAVSKEKLSAHLGIIDGLIRSFWLDGLITRNRSMLSVRLEQYIEGHLTEKIYLSDLCERFFLSKNALYRLFRKEFGTTVNEYILMRRLSRAESLLKTDLSLDVAGISAASGFPDYNYFIRAFKKHKGITPLQYRKNTTK